MHNRDDIASTMTESPEPKVPRWTEALVNSDYGLIRETPGLEYLFALRDSVLTWRRERIKRNLATFIEEVERKLPDPKHREQVFKDFAHSEDRNTVLDVLPEILEDRDGELKSEILARLLLALLDQRVSLERFLDLTHILQRASARTIKFLATMATAGFDIEGGIEEYAEEASLLVAAGVAIRENGALKVNKLGRDLQEIGEIS